MSSIAGSFKKVCKLYLSFSFPKLHLSMFHSFLLSFAFHDYYIPWRNLKITREWTISYVAMSPARIQDPNPASAPTNGVITPGTTTAPTPVAPSNLQVTSDSSPTASPTFCTAQHRANQALRGCPFYLQMHLSDGEQLHPSALQFQWQPRRKGRGPDWQTSGATSLSPMRGSVPNKTAKRREGSRKGGKGEEGRS